MSRLADKIILEQALHYQFKNPRLLDQALTHGSATARNKDTPTYERLEFLGDRVLGLVMAEWLYEAYPDAEEGILASHFAALVGRESLAEIAALLELGSYLDRAKNDTQSARGESSMLADALEAIFAAIYLESGIDKVKPVIRDLFADLFAQQATAPRDSKTALQEWAQARRYPVPVYTVTSRTGPSHAPEFEIEVVVKNAEPVRATGSSKQEAEKAAATLLLEKLYD